MKRGGIRVGAGRKPHRIRLLQPAVETAGAVGASELSVAPPDDLPAEHREFWQRYAPLAIEKRTLTAHTVAGFRLLCEVDAERRKTAAVIEADGRTYIRVSVDGAGVEHEELRVHPLTTAYHRLQSKTEGLLGRFGLAPFGKAEPIIVKAKAPSQWAAVMEK